MTRVVEPPIPPRETFTMKGRPSDDCAAASAGGVLIVTTFTGSAIEATVFLVGESKGMKSHNTWSSWEFWFLFGMQR